MSEDHDGATQQPRRCQGCGEAVPSRKINEVRVANSRWVRYCDQCESLRDHYDIQPEAHEQYRLKELADELVEQS